MTPQPSSPKPSAPPKPLMWVVPKRSRRAYRLWAFRSLTTDKIKAEAYKSLLSGRLGFLLKERGGDLEDLFRAQESLLDPEEWEEGRLSSPGVHPQLAALNLLEHPQVNQLLNLVVGHQEEVELVRLSPEEGKEAEKLVADEWMEEVNQLAARM